LKKRVGVNTEGVAVIVQNGKCSTVEAEAVVHHKDQDNRGISFCLRNMYRVHLHVFMWNFPL
jgi:hypothetical protein